MPKSHNASEPVDRPLRHAGPAPLTIAVLLNGKGPFHLVVDTGATLTVVSPDVAEELGLEPFDQVVRRGAGGTVTIDLARVDTVRSGNVERTDAVIGISRQATRLCKTAAGNIGFDILQHFVLRFDVPRRRAALLAETPVDTVSAPLPFRIGEGGKSLILLPATLDEQGPFQFALDTGAMATCIAPSLAEQLDLVSVGGSAVQAIGVGGPVDAAFASRPVTLTIGNRTRSGVHPIIIDIFGPMPARDDADIFDPKPTRDDTGSSGPVMGGDGPHIVGLIGADVLRSSVLIVDYPHRRLWID